MRMRFAILLASVLLAPMVRVPDALADPGPPVGPQPGYGYGSTGDSQGHLLTHISNFDVLQGTMTYSSVLVGTASTLVLAAPTTVARNKLYLVNASGRLAGTTATDVWCAYGAPAVVGQGFMLAGYGDRVTEDVTALLDQRALSCISTAPTTINVGASQQ